MKTTKLVCPNCNGTLDYNIDEPVMECPYCGTKVMLDENDSITKERIKAKTFKEVEFEKIKQETDRDLNKYKFEIEKKKIKFTWFKAACCIAIFCLVLFGMYKVYDAISHIGSIKIPLSSQEYIGKSYMDVERLLKDTGFKKVETVNVSDLSKPEEQLSNLVRQVSINGYTDFKANQWFKKDAPVKVVYHTINPERENDRKVPVSSKDLIGKKYREAEFLLKSSGFSNIKQIIIEDLPKKRQSEDGNITAVSIGGKVEFSESTWFPSDSEVNITVHKLDPEKIKDVSSPLNYAETAGKDVKEIVKLFSRDFIYITLIPENAEKVSKKDANKTINVTINNTIDYDSSTYFPFDAEVKVFYHAKNIEEKDYVEKNHDDETILALFSDLGLQAPKNVSMQDHNDYSSKEIGKISSITVDGKELKDVSEYHLDSEITIYFHSQLEPGQDRVVVNMTQKELTKLELKEAKYQLQMAGFINVVLEPLKDIPVIKIKDWTMPVEGFSFKNESIKEIKVKGISIKKGYVFRNSDEVIIYYHSYKE